MAYCGILDGIVEIDGKPVDLSELENGKIIAGDEIFDADDWITDEDKLELFNETAMRTKEDLLKELESLLNRIAEERKTNVKHSKAYYDRYRELVQNFKNLIEKKSFPEKLENWWSYGYEIRATGAYLTVSHADLFDVGANDTVSSIIDTKFDLLSIKTKLLTVEQYAQSFGVTTTTVRQWIRRGKIRTAIKQGSEWRIPELAEVTDRGYTEGHYGRTEYLTDLPEDYSFFNEYDSVDLYQNKENKGMFDVEFWKKVDDQGTDEPDWDKYRKIMQMDQKEREKFELYLISSPFVEPVEASIAFRD